MSRFARCSVWRRLVLLMILLITTALLAGPASAQCNGPLRGDCSYGMIGYYIDCDCDSGPPCNGAQGPPQFMCAYESCARTGLFTWWCSAEGINSWACIAGSEVEPNLCSCSKDGFACTFID
jgi:hypothetical protein